MTPGAAEEVGFSSATAHLAHLAQPQPAARVTRRIKFRECCFLHLHPSILPTTEDPPRTRIAGTPDRNINIVMLGE